MTSRDYCFWAQGFFELLGEDLLDLEKGRLQEIMGQMKAHLGLVFVHEIDPQMGDAAHQAKLNSLHESGEPKPGTTQPAGPLVYEPGKLDTGVIFGPPKPNSANIILRC